MLAALLLLIAVGGVQTVRADTLDTVIDVVLYAVEPSLVEAKPLVKCLAQGGSVSDCGQQYASQQASDAVAGAMAGDPKIALVVDIVQAASGGDWITVLELTGTQLLTQIACSAAMPGGGPVKGFICSGLFSKVAGLAQPVVREVLVAIRDGNWLKLIALTGPDLACQIIPSGDPVTTTACSVLGSLIGETGELISNGASAAWSQIEDWSEDLQGQTQHMSYDEFYRRYLVHLVQKRALERVMFNRQGLGLDPAEWDACVSYFDSHKQATDTAEKTCTDLGHRLHNESVVFAEYAGGVPRAYFDTELKPGLRDRVAENYWNTDVEDYQSLVFKLTPAQWGMGQQPPNANPYFDDYDGSFAGITRMLYGGNSFLAFPQFVPDSLRDWAIYQSAGVIYAKALAVEKLRLKIAVNPKLIAAGCAAQASPSGRSLVFRCGNFDGYVACRDSFAGYRYSHCSIDQVAADTTLGQKLAQLLGSKRCTFLAESKEGYHDPRVVCTRPWKQAQCNQLLAQSVQDPQLQGQPFMQNTVRCDYYPEPAFVQGREKANAIATALNAPATSEPDPAPASESAARQRRALQLKAKRPEVKRANHAVANNLVFINCAPTWDPLALHCTDPEVLFELPQRLPGTTLPPCAADPAKDGADAPCYSGAYPIRLPPKRRTVIDKPGRKLTLPGHDGNAPAPGLGGMRPSKKAAPSRQMRPSEAARSPGAAKLTAPAKPDQAVAAWATLAGQRARWGGVVSLPGRHLRSVGGSCQAKLVYGVENRGTAMNPAASHAAVTVTGRRGTVRVFTGRIAPGQTRTAVASVTLRSGQNRLTLVLDHEGRVDELDEGNNRAVLTVNVEGGCGTSRQPAARTTSPAPAMRNAPPTRLHLERAQ